MRSCDPQEVPRLQSGGAFYAPRRIRTAPSWMPFFTHLQLGLLCRDERVARVCELLAARRVKSSLHLYNAPIGFMRPRAPGTLTCTEVMVRLCKEWALRQRQCEPPDQSDRGRPS